MPTYSGSGLRFVMPNQFAVNPSGVPYVGGQLFFYATGTTTYQDTYQDSGLTIPNTNPVVADSGGYFGNIFLLGSPSYHVVLQDANNNTIWDMDPVGPQIAAAGTVPVGTEVDFAGATAPAGWLFEFGQAISRTTYAALFAVLGTTYGSGDGSTTFNIPDGRGTVYAGLDNMGGTAAGRLTYGGSGMQSTTLGFIGGSQILQGHTHSVTDPGHSHTATASTLTASVAEGYGVLQSAGSYGFTIPIFQQYGTISIAAPIITVGTSTTGITINETGTGTFQNVQPTGMRNKIIYTGVGG